MRAELEELHRKETRGVKRSREESGPVEAQIKVESTGTTTLVKEEIIADEENINWEE